MKKNLITGAACYFDYYRSCVVEYSIDRSNQKTEAVTEDIGGVTSFSSKVVGDAVLEVTKVQEMTAYAVDEVANFLILLEKEEYLIQRHPHLSSFLPSPIEFELLDENLQADKDLLIAMRKKPNFKAIDYSEKLIVDKALILLARHVKSWFFASFEKPKPSFSVANLSSWQSQEEEYPTAPRRVGELEQYFASKKYSKTSTKVLEDGQILTVWKRHDFPTYTTLYEPTGREAVALY